MYTILHTSATEVLKCDLTWKLEGNDFSPSTFENFSGHEVYFEIPILASVEIALIESNDKRCIWREK